MHRPDRHLSSTALALLIPMMCLAAPAAAVDDVRRTPVVDVVQRATPAVVNIATDQRVENPFGGSPFGRLLRDYFDERRGSRRERYVHNSLGSGVLVDPDGFVVTNAHVIWGASRIRVTLQDGRTLLAQVVGTDSESDLAVLRLDGEGPFPYVPLGRSDDLLIGETVVAIGNPYGFSSSVTTGVISAVERSIETSERVFTDFIQTDALINPGNSGGPLLNIKGELVGVNNAVYTPAQGIGFAIPVDRVRRVIEDLISFGEVRHPWFGFLVEEYGQEGDVLGQGAAVRVRTVFIDSPADRQGLRPGDRLVAISGRAIGSRADFDTALSNLAVGSSARFEVSRGHETLTVTLRGGEFPGVRAGDYFRELTGLQLGDIPASLRRRYPHLPERGLLVTDVTPGSRAERVGLRPGDVIVRLGRDRVAGVADLPRVVPEILGRNEFFLVVLRGRAAYNLTFRLI